MNEQETLVQIISFGTDIPRGVPPIVRDHTKHAADMIGRRLDHDEMARKLYKASPFEPFSALLFYP
jgi:hypothetical protein